MTPVDDVGPVSAGETELESPMVLADAAACKQRGQSVKIQSIAHIASLARCARCRKISGPSRTEKCSEIAVRTRDFTSPNQEVSRSVERA